MRQQLLLIEDVDSLGKKGEVVTAKPGYFRNFLLPKGFAVVATSNTLRKQERLREERAKQAIIDKQESEMLAQQIVGLSLEITVKVDPEGHMYGSVSASDIVDLCIAKGLPLTKKNIQLTRPIKETGIHEITVKLKEGVSEKCKLKIIPEGMSLEGLEAVTAPILTEESAQTQKTEEKPTE